MADPQDRLLADYCPPLDSALVYAILSDYSSPLSTEDEQAARELLSSLAKEAEATLNDQPEGGHLYASNDNSASLASSDEPIPIPPVEDERVELLRLLDQAAAELAPRSKQQQQLRPLARTPSNRSAQPAAALTTAISDVTNALETTSHGGASSSSASGGSGASTDLTGTTGAAGGNHAGQARFWNGSTASSVTTASEGGDLLLDETATDSIPHQTVTGQPATLVWDPTIVGDDDFGTFYDVQDDPLAFLASVFPHIELAQLEAKINEATAANASADAAAGPLAPTRPGDLEALIEDLLSQDLITSLTEADAEAAAAANALAPDPDRIADLSKQQKRRVKAAHKAANSFSLTSTPHVSYASAAKAAEDGRTASALAAAPSGANAWVSFSSQASLLATLLHIPPTRVTSTYYQQSSSLPLTISTLLTQLATERVFEAIPNALELKAQLRLIVPLSRASDDDLEVLLSATEGDLSDALDLHHFIRDVEASMGTNLTLSSLVAREAETNGNGIGSTASDGFTLVPSAAARRATAASSASHLPAGPSDRYSYEDCASLALEYLVKRNEAFRTAARSFQRGGQGERGAAGYWAEKGREYDRERRKWEERAARAAVGERRHKTQDPYTIDLHGLTLAHALTIVDETCNSWWSANRDSEHVPPLRIITGVGRHSRNNAPILAPAVTKHLDRHGWYWRWDDSPLTHASGISTPGGGVAGGVKGAVKVLGVK
ncbi:hypothetical protein JCM10908_005857 [Rhodotorula pacifica]|uniref:uncharacterized protein n=1 Tax=Rhodotorula pacifica TaxID=1495444 RepID=UPI00317D8E64